MANKEYRNMKVYEQGGYHYKSMPAIMLKGQWLRELGFEENTPIVVQCEDGILTITRADTEADYLDIPETVATCVAEPKAKYGRARA